MYKKKSESQKILSPALTINGKILFFSCEFYQIILQTLIINSIDYSVSLEYITIFVKQISFASNSLEAMFKLLSAYIMIGLFYTV